MNNLAPLCERELSQVGFDRAGFGELRAELHKRSDDLDLVELWAELPHSERRMLLKSADIQAANGRYDTKQQISQLNKRERDALRGAIHRMSNYANQLKGRLHGSRPHPSRELASHAIAALKEGNAQAAHHWLTMIEGGVA